MRPLRLTIQGLRSYRHECRIDFESRALIAIVGDTGAGKSSILEAITYVLYNSTTWNASEVKALIADGAQTMKVELEFLAGGGRWSVLRSTSRTNYPPSVHRLQRLDEADAVPLLGEDAVRRQVEKLLGMNRKAFLSAVILPQGRFQALLQEETAERTRILKGIFRLGELEAVRGQADVLRRRAEPSLAQLRGRRGTLMESPEEEVRRLGSELEAAGSRRKQLEELRAIAHRARELEREIAPQMGVLDGPAAELRRLLGADVAPHAVLAGLAAEAARLDADAASARARRGELEGTERARAEAGGREPYERLLTAAQAMRRALTDLGELESGAADLARRAEVLDAERNRLAGADQALSGLKAAAEQAAAAATDAEAAVERQRQRFQEVRALLLRWRQAQEQERAAMRERDGAVTARQEKASQVDGPRAAHVASGASLADARAVLEDVRRAHAAVHAAQGLGPQDPCPVCARPLPSSFAPPAAGAMEPAEHALLRAEEARQKATAALAGAVAAEEQAAARLAESERRVADADGQAARRLDELRGLLPTAKPAESDDALLGPIERDGKALAGTASGAREAAARAASAHDGEAGALAPRRDALMRESAQLERDRARVARTETACRAQLSALSPLVALPDGSPAVAELRPALAGLEERLERARVEREEAEARRAEIDSLGRHIEALHDARRRDVEVPLDRVKQTLGELRMATRRGRQALELDGDEELAEGADPSRLAAHAERLSSAARGVLTALDARQAELRKRMADEREEAGRMLRVHGFDDVAAVDRELDQMVRLLGAIEVQLAEARRQAPLVQKLNEAIAEGADLCASLQELGRLLGDGQFVRYVVARRQRVLLEVASETLGVMSGGRYGFAADFQIVDRLSGQPRSTKTLSGGETFLASLALALSLVEIASRSGGRLDALFLDEGFGSLDANALDDALGALERRAGDGRLVAVVSHVKAVAERIEHVLAVTKPPTGSIAEWRDEIGRHELVEEEIASGLLV